MPPTPPQTAPSAHPPHPASSAQSPDAGFMLLGLIVAIAIILLVLSVAAAQVAFSLRREREVESLHRANQYVRAIRLYYRKFGHYPGSLQQLENTNHIRFLRQQYIDPLTGKSDWRLIGVGQNKTTVKGFFGQPLAGIPTAGLGALAGSQSVGGGFPGGNPTTASPNGPNSTAMGAPTTAANPTDATNSAGQSGATTPGSTGSTTSALGTLPTSTNANGTPFGSGSAGLAPFMGVGTSASGDSIATPNEQASYQLWEFLYDPRIEQLKVAGQLNGGGVGSAPASSLGQTPNPTGQTPGQPPGQTTPGQTQP
jgi:type II secretory pathway pseudopilin PulG